MILGYVVTLVSHVMLNGAGIRIRMSLTAVIVTELVFSVTVRTLAVVAACPAVNVWFAAEETIATEPPACAS
jgi:hypothetical protein